MSLLVWVGFEPVSQLWIARTMELPVHRVATVPGAWCLEMIVILLKLQKTHGKCGFFLKVCMSGERLYVCSFGFYAITEVLNSWCHRCTILHRTYLLSNFKNLGKFATVGEIQEAQVGSLWQNVSFWFRRICNGLLHLSALAKRQLKYPKDSSESRIRNFKRKTIR